MSIPISKRLGSMLLDHFSMCFLALIIAAPMMIINFFILRFFDFDFTWMVGLIVFTVYFNKDFFRGRSLGKRISGLVVLDNQSQKIASPFQCFIRNLTIVLWPIEVFISLFSRKRRLGDFIAGTRLGVTSTEGLSSIKDDFQRCINKENKDY